MKRSQINYVIDKAHAIAQTFRVCLPEFAYFTVDDWLQREQDNWQEVVDLQLGWDITDFGRGDFNQTGLTLLTMRNGALGSAAYPKPYAEKMLQIQQDQQTPGIFTPTNGRYPQSGRWRLMHAVGLGQRSQSL